MGVKPQLRPSTFNQRTTAETSSSPLKKPNAAYLVSESHARQGCRAVLPSSGHAKAVEGTGCMSQPPLHRLGWDPQATSWQSITQAAETPITKNCDP